LEQFDTNFAGIPMKMIPFIRRSDLTAHLGIPMLEVNRIWTAIQKLPFKLPPPLQAIDDSVRSYLSISLSISTFTESKRNEHQTHKKHTYFIL
jgi:hypothetical protein